MPYMVCKDCGEIVNGKPGMTEHYRYTGHNTFSPQTLKKA